MDEISVVADDFEIIPISSFEEEIIAIEDLDVLVVEVSGDGIKFVTSNWYENARKRRNKFNL